MKITGIDNAMFETYIENIADVINMLNNFSDVIYNSVARTNGLEGWFKEYIVSDTFKELTPQFKKEAFETFSHLKFLLRFIKDNQLSNK